MGNTWYEPMTNVLRNSNGYLDPRLIEMQYGASHQSAALAASLAQQNAAMDAYAAGLLRDFNRRAKATITDGEKGAPFEDTFRYSPPPSRKNPFDWTLPIRGTWGDRFAKVYFTLLALTPVYLLLAFLGY